MKYWSQLEMEKLLEWIYARQEAKVTPEERKTNEILREMREIIYQISQENFDFLDMEMGLKRRDG